MRCPASEPRIVNPCLDKAFQEPEGILMPEIKRDKTLEDSFPASDPPSDSGITGVGRPHHPSHKRSISEKPTGTPTSDRHGTETAHQWEDEDKA
jgi:hypothetical protein